MTMLLWLVLLVSILAPSHEGALQLHFGIVFGQMQFQSSRPLTRARYTARGF